MPGVARVDHRTKCVSLVAISLSQNFETRKQARQQAKKYTLGTVPKENTTLERTPKKIPPRNGPQRKYHPIVVTKKQIITKKQT
jgi:hypothetical protein